MWYEHIPCWLTGHRYGHIHEGYQYCAKCGTAKAAPCIHKWKVARDTGYGPWEKLPNGEVKHTVTYHIVTLQCTKCGDFAFRRDQG